MSIYSNKWKIRSSRPADHLLRSCLPRSNSKAVFCGASSRHTALPDPGHLPPEASITGPLHSKEAFFPSRDSHRVFFFFLFHVFVPSKSRFLLRYEVAFVLFNLKNLYIFLLSLSFTLLTAHRDRPPDFPSPPPDLSKPDFL